MSRIFRAAVTDARPVVIDVSLSSPVGAKQNKDKERGGNSEEEARLQAHQIIEHAHKEAKRLLDEAHRQRKQLLDQAAAEAEQIRIQAAEQGYQDGFGQGQQQAHKLIAQAEKLKLEIANEKKEYLLKADQQILELAVEIAEHIIKQKLEQDTSALLSIVQAALNEVVTAQRVVVKVSAGDYGTVVQHQQELERVLPRECELLIVASSDCQLGDCIIQTESVEIDATLNNALAKIRGALQEVLPA